MDSMIRPRIRLRSLASLLMLVPALAAAQATALTGNARTAALTELVLSATDDPSDSRPAVNPISSATIVANAAGTTGKFRIGFRLDDNNYAHVTLSAPATDGKTTIVLGDELPSGTKVTFEFSRVMVFKRRLHCCLRGTEVHDSGDSVAGSYSR
jgi:hypothetical protein